MVLVQGMLLLSVLAPLIFASWSIPQLGVGEDFDNAPKTRTFGIVLRPDQVAPPQPGLLDPRVLEERGEVPLILIDAAERSVDIPVLQFPLWLAFAAGPGERLDDDDLL